LEEYNRQQNISHHEIMLQKFDSQQKFILHLENNLNNDTNLGFSEIHIKLDKNIIKTQKCQRQ
jgi:hypothetical protein